MIVHLIDGTYELFRHFYGIRHGSAVDPPFGAVAGVLHTVAQMIEGGATHSPRCVHVCRNAPEGDTRLDRSPQ